VRKTEIKNILFWEFDYLFWESFQKNLFLRKGNRKPNKKPGKTKKLSGLNWMLRA
jgi:hypothetical protein